MNTIVFLILRRMRIPLLLLSVVYAVATFGLTLIPGIDDKGNVWHMDLFHAFYFVSFMGTTIGFGEIPFEFSDAQRFWVLIFVYITVATWIYFIGTLIALLSHDTLQKALTEYRFRRRVEKLDEPFHIICGYGDTGSKLVHSLAQKNLLVTIIDIDPQRLDQLTLDEHPIDIPGLCGDAADPGSLLLAGVTHPQCASVLALTNDNAANLHIAITAKLVNPGMKVICRADSHEIERNLASFGTDFIVDPFDTFAAQLGFAISMPHQFMLNRWFHAEENDLLKDLVIVPDGRWILCGYGRFGRAVHAEMLRRGLEVQVVEPRTGEDQPEGMIVGLGTEADTLSEAGVMEAAGIIAGSDDDTNNLSIIVTAKEMNPEIFTVARQTENHNRQLFTTSVTDLVMAPSDTLVNKIRTLLTNPMIDEFLSLANAHDDEWAGTLTEKLRDIDRYRLADIWTVNIDAENAHAVMLKLKAGEDVRLGHLVHDHRDRTERLEVLPLLHVNSKGAFSMPDLNSQCHAGDRLLFAGSTRGASCMQWNLQNEVALTYVMTGRTLQQTPLGRWLETRLAS